MNKSIPTTTPTLAEALDNVYVDPEALDGEGIIEMLEQLSADDCAALPSWAHAVIRIGYALDNECVSDIASDGAEDSSWAIRPSDTAQYLYIVAGSEVYEANDWVDAVSDSLERDIDQDSSEDSAEMTVYRSLTA